MVAQNGSGQRVCPRSALGIGSLCENVRLSLQTAQVRHKSTRKPAQSYRRPDTEFVEGGRDSLVCECCPKRLPFARRNAAIGPWAALYADHLDPLKDYILPKLDEEAPSWY